MVCDVHGDDEGFRAALAGAQVIPLLEDGKVVILNGDFLDRGHAQDIVLLQVMLLKIRYPDRFFILAGNHEVRWASWQAVCEVVGLCRA